MSSKVSLLSVSGLYPSIQYTFGAISSKFWVSVRRESSNNSGNLRFSYNTRINNVYPMQIKRYLYFEVYAKSLSKTEKYQKKVLNYSIIQI